jgi:hypothetical protein
MRFIPAQAGTHLTWAPAFAGATAKIFIFCGGLVAQSH